jgi:hypothetical protein
VRKGDYVYCFDDDRKPAIGKVLWAGKTGHRKVVRIHWKAGPGRKGYLDVTPEHRIRLIDGRYVPAKELCKDWRCTNSSKHSLRTHVLAMARYHHNDDRLQIANAVKFGADCHTGNHIILRVEELDDAVDVYDIEVEGAHNFIANEICIHNSSSSPNFQNIPKRDKEAMKLVRQGIFPPKGYEIVGADYRQIEVVMQAVLANDQVMLEYVTDTNSDMHRDTALDLLCLSDNDWGKMDKDTILKLRRLGKNRFNFPEIYGDWYGSIALVIWEKDIIDGKLSFNGKYSVKKHLHNKGIRDYEAFKAHVKSVERRFWKKFHATAQWREDTIEFYKKHMYIENPFGGRRNGHLKRNEICNSPVQMTAFQCLLWSVIQLNNLRKKEGWKSKIIGQIHDQIVFAIHPSEKKRLLVLIEKVMCQDIRQAFPWIIVPLRIEFEFSGVNNSWAVLEEE